MPKIRVPLSELDKKIDELEKSNYNVSEIHRISNDLDYDVYYYEKQESRKSDKKNMRLVAQISIDDMASMFVILKDFLQKNNELAACLNTNSIAYDNIYERLWDVFGNMTGLNSPKIPDDSEIFKKLDDILQSADDIPEEDGIKSQIVDIIRMANAAAEKV